jgi:ferredoxin-NADP reductase
MLEFNTATVIDIVNETYNTKRFFLAMDNMDTFSYQAGQFITLDLPIHEKKNKRLRSYSIASAPNGTKIIELVIVLLQGGLGTTYLFNEVTIGSQLNYRGPLGHFTAPMPKPKHLILICTGTGIAPFRSMVLDAFNNKETEQQLYLICGVRTQADLLYHTEMLQLATAMPNLHYLPTLSREQIDGCAYGYVHPIYTSLAADKPDAAFMLCGWRNMIDEAREKLTALGFDKTQVHYELYG